MLCEPSPSKGERILTLLSAFGRTLFCISITAPKLAALLRGSSVTILQNQSCGPAERGFRTALSFQIWVNWMTANADRSRMRRIETMLKERETVARSYHQLLENCGDVILPVARIPQGRSSWFGYVVRLRERFTTAQRDAVLSRLASAEIACGRYFALIHRRPCDEAWRNLYFLPVTESVSARTSHYHSLIN
jgi:dTDP-4-amino-4,6-dideoxygalactose transaminase